MKNKQNISASRAAYYGILSKFFIYQDNLSERYFALKETLPILAENPLDDESKKALQRMATFFQTEENEKLIAEEFDKIFYVPDVKTLRNTASYYDDGIEGGKKQLEVKSFLAKTKIRRNEKYFKETEDSVGFILLFMYELIELIRQGNKEYENIEHCFFVQILNPFIDSFANDLFNHPNSNYYKDVAIILNSFMDFERVLFEVTKPKLIDKTGEVIISRSERYKRAQNKARKGAL